MNYKKLQKTSCNKNTARHEHCQIKSKYLTEIKACFSCDIIAYCISIYFLDTRHFFGAFLLLLIDICRL